MRKPLRVFVCSALTVVLALTLSACGSAEESGDSTTPGTSSATSSESAFVPAEPMIANPDWSDPFDGSVTLPGQVSGAVVADMNYEDPWGPVTKSNPNGPEPTQVDGENVLEFSAVDQYRGYDPSMLNASEGTFELYFRPAENILTEFTAEKQSSWTSFGEYPPPPNGGLIDTIGWRAAPDSSYGLWVGCYETTTAVSWGIWDGTAWHNAYFEAPAWNASDWHLITVSYGPAGVRLYLDGELAAEDTTYTDGIDLGQPFFLGQAPWYWPYGPHTILGQVKGFRYSASQL